MTVLKDFSRKQRKQKKPGTKLMNELRIDLVNDLVNAPSDDQ